MRRPALRGSVALLVGLIMLALWLADGGLTGGSGARQEARREGSRGGTGYNGAAAVRTEVTGKVVIVHDGDTITVELDAPLADGTRRLKLRLLGIDAPEMSQEYGEAARTALDQRIYRRTVRVVYDETDRYGRALADVYEGACWINLELVETGLAWNYSSPADARLAAAQRAAAAAQRGLWATPHPIPPRQWRQQHPRL